MIRPIFPLTLDPARYLTIVPVEPVQTPDGLTPPVKATLDYALLAARRAGWGWRKIGRQWKIAPYRVQREVTRYERSLNA